MSRNAQKKKYIIAAARALVVVWTGDESWRRLELGRQEYWKLEPEVPATI